MLQRELLYFVHIFLIDVVGAVYPFRNGNIDAALKYMSDMENLTADMSFPVSTNNPVLDILIGNKLGIAKNNQIVVQCSFIASYPCGIADIDFCIIFSKKDTLVEV